MRHTIIDNRYKILKKLGAGATGMVYKVKDLKDSRIIALKILSKKKISPESIQRFKREFRLLTGLHHPNLCEVYDFGVLKDGQSYFTMEYIDGGDVFNATKGVTYKKVYPWIVQLCQVLEYIHSKGLIHYDIKPGNVLIAKGSILEKRVPPKGREFSLYGKFTSFERNKGQGAESKKPYTLSPVACIKLMDFGLAGEQQIKGGRLIRGTFPYIAPEVIKGLAVDHRADLYSLGVLLYEIFTRKAFQEGKENFVTLLKLMQDRMYEPPSRIVANIPKGLERLTIRLIDVEPASRFSRANEIIKEINKFSRFKFEFETEKTLESYLLSSRFVGRDKEMEVLTSFYEQARKGEGKIVLVTGEVGVGKSRLLKEFKIFTQLRRGHCFTGYAYKDKTGSLEPFYDVFKELINYIRDGSVLLHSRELKLSLAVLFKIFPDLKDNHLKRDLPKLVPLEPKQEKLRTFDALSELVRHTTLELGELVILLEDLHWADDLSIQFLEYLGRNLAGRNIFICGTCRKEELEENPALKKAITSLKVEGCLSKIELKPLKFRSLYSFLDSTITSGSNSSELVRYLMGKTGGNPFFVEEIMRTLLRKKGMSIGEKIGIEDLKRISIPETIEDIVLRRIKDLDSNSQKIVKFGAILLKDFGYDLMKKLTGLEDTELSTALWQLKSRQVLLEEGNTYRFYHATLREAINKRMAYREKRKLYYQTGRTLELIYKRNIEGVVEDLAYYFINAKDRKKGIKYGLRAAKKSSERYANEQAIRFYKGVLGFLSSKDTKNRFNILQNMAQSEVLDGRYYDAIRHYNNAFNLKTASTVESIKLCTNIGGVYESIGEYKKALLVYKRGLRYLKKIRAGRLKNILEADINVKRCRVYYTISDYKCVSQFNFDGLDFLKDDLKEKEAIDLQGNIYNTMALIETVKAPHSEIHSDRAIFYYKKAYNYYKKIKHKDKMATILNGLGIIYHRKLDYSKSRNCYEKSISISKKWGFQHQLSTAYCNLGNILREKGNYSKSLDYFQESLSISKRIGHSSIGVAFLQIGICLLHIGCYKEAQEHFTKALNIFATMGWKRGEVHSIHGIGNFYQTTGEYTAALKTYRKAAKITNAIGYEHGHALLFIDIGSVFIEIGQLYRARKYLEDALRIEADTKQISAEIEYYMHVCYLNILQEDYLTAIEHYKIGRMLARKKGTKRQLLQFFLLGSELNYYENKYLKGIKNANKAIKLAKEMGTKDLHAMALLIKVKNEVKQGILSKIEVFTLLDEAKRIAEEIGYPEVLWKVHYEYARFLQKNREYRKALQYHGQCIGVFKDVMSKIKNASYKKSYLNRPDRQVAIKLPSLLLPEFEDYLKKD